ncbi:MAG: DUF418 domain-containing protein [Bacteroidota bacterium]
MNGKPTSLNPIGKKERIHVLDCLRGFAIFGIFIINIRVFSGYSYASDEFNNNLLFTSWDSVFDWIHVVFFSGKFYSLFSLLFGIGFAIQLERASSANRNFISFFSRRLFFLLLIGIVHLWLIWFNDILLLYAIGGYILILFRKIPNKGLLWYFLILIIMSGLHDWYLQAVNEPYVTEIYKWITESWKSVGLPEASNDYKSFRMSDIAAVIRDESWSTVLNFNKIGPLLRLYFVSYDARIIKILSMFVLGYWVGRNILFNSLHKNRPFLIKIAVAGWLTGIPLNAYFLYNDLEIITEPYNIIIKGILVPFGYVSLSSAYAATFALLYRTRLKNIMDNLFQSVGKTALSNYILQSFLGIFLFYSAGLGLGEYTGSTLLTPLVFIIFLVQIVISNIWLKHFRYGPLEWIWRVLTYGRFIKIRQK